jgi:hypothetical protein
VGKIADHVGVFEVIRNSNYWHFHSAKEARLNDQIDPIAQLKLLRKDELANFAMKCGARKPLSRSSMIRLISNRADEIEINSFFKTSMLNRASN